METFDAIGIQNILGWIFTIILSIMGAWYTINVRVYAVEKKIELVQMQVDNINKSMDKQEEDMKEVKDMFYQIDKNIVEIRGILNTKADKNYTQLKT